MPRARAATQAAGRSIADPAGIDPAGVRGPVVYLICLSPCYKHARHYVGFTSDLSQRLEAHRTGAGSPLLAAAIAAGCTLTVTRVWTRGNRTFERRLHKRHDSPRLCSRCSERPKPARRSA